jgi:hypothetical protein
MIDEVRAYLARCLKNENSATGLTGGGGLALITSSGPPCVEINHTYKHTPGLLLSEYLQHSACSVWLETWIWAAQVSVTPSQLRSLNCAQSYSTSADAAAVPASASPSMGHLSQRPDPACDLHTVALRLAGCGRCCTDTTLCAQAVADASDVTVEFPRLRKGHQYRELRKLCSQLLSSYANSVIGYMRTLRVDNARSQTPWNRLSPRAVRENESSSNMKRFLHLTATTFEPGLLSTQAQLRTLCT